MLKYKKSSSLGVFILWQCLKTQAILFDDSGFCKVLLFLKKKFWRVLIVILIIIIIKCSLLNVPNFRYQSFLPKVTIQIANKNIYLQYI